jgi:hypothetical protein
VRSVFAGETAVLSFRRRWAVTHRPSGVSFSATSRMTEVFVCRGQEWKVLAFHETLMPNAERPVSAAAPAHYEEYVGRYRFGSKGDGTEIEERFVRDTHGQVVGILYTMGDSEVEARRAP